MNDTVGRAWMPSDRGVDVADAKLRKELKRSQIDYP